MARILFVNIEGRISGAEKSLLLLIEHLNSKHQTHLACPKQGDLAEAARILGCQTHTIPAPVPKVSYLSISYFVYWLVTSIRIWFLTLYLRAEIVHANSTYAAVVSLFATVGSGAKLIWHVRDFTRHRTILRFCGTFSKRAIAISESVRLHLNTMGVDTEKVTVVYNGISSKMAARPDHKVADASKFPSHSPHSMTFCNIGQFVPWKRQDLFIEAAARVAAETKDVRFLLVGADIFGRNDEYRCRLERCADKLGISKQLSWVPWHKDMGHIWRSIDCLVHTAEREPFGRVVVEAMACGVPVIAADACGPSEIIADGHTGLLCKPGDPVSFSRAMLQLVKTPELMRNISSNASQHVYDRFSAESTAESVGRIYEEILASRSASAA